MYSTRYVHFDGNKKKWFTNMFNRILKWLQPTLFCEHS
jgi:hypothetical protein